MIPICIIFIILLGYTIFNLYIFIEYIINSNYLFSTLYLLLLIISYVFLIYYSYKIYVINNNINNTINNNITSDIIIAIKNYCYIINPAENDICLGIKL